MINIHYRLISPQLISSDFVDEDFNKYDLVVKPTYLSICKADQRYYQGTREKEILQEKLPMSLIHEAIGTIVYSKNKNFQPNDNVVLIPNVTTNNTTSIKDNYLNTSKFHGSNCDGFMQSYIFCQSNNVIKIPQNTPSMVLLELLSVVFNAINSISKITSLNEKSIAIYGDGSLSYITALVLYKILPSSNLTVIGKHNSKLDYFTFIKNIYTLDQLPRNLSFDCAFECVGGLGSERAINQIIDYINPQGYINLLGVNEDKVLINTRKVVEKGITIIGNSRSDYNDFLDSINFIEQFPNSLNYLEKIISDKIEIFSITDINKAFEIDHNNNFKTIMEWKI